MPNLNQNNNERLTMYKNNCAILGLTKGCYKFTASDFPAENPRTQNRTILILTVSKNK